MSLEADLTKNAEKFLRGRPPKQQRQISHKILGLCQDPLPNDSSTLSGKWCGFRRADMGEFRIIYRFDRATLFVAKIGKRNDGEVYR